MVLAAWPKVVGADGVVAVLVRLLLSSRAAVRASNRALSTVPRPCCSVWAVARSTISRGWRLVSVRAASARSGLAARSEEHTSELQSLMRISYAVFCLKKKTHQQNQ